MPSPGRIRSDIRGDPHRRPFAWMEESQDYLRIPARTFLSTAASMDGIACPIQTIAFWRPEESVGASHDLCQSLEATGPYEST